MLEWILGKLGGKCGLHWSGSEKGPVAGSCEHSAEPLGSIQGRELIDWVTISFLRGLSTIDFS
jgi:hypothetical protein